MRRALALLLLLAPLAGAAQGRIYRIAVLEREPSSANAANFAALRQGLRELGYVEGTNLAIGYRSTEGKDELYPALCADAVQHKADLIIVRGTASAQACMRATRTIPIVFSGVDDPVAEGLVADAGHPGGNVTGLMYTANPVVAEARLDVLRDVFPRIRTLGAMLNLGRPELARQRAYLESAGRELGIAVTVFDVRTLPDLQTSFALAASERLEAVYVPVDDMTMVHRKLVAELGLKHRLPVVSTELAFIEAGGLLAYGPDPSAQYKRLAAIADRIFRGGKVGEIPVERPAIFVLAVNLKTARALGVRIPRQVLSRADRVIQ
jgi:putative ABC transport system substrate-binding protein